LQEKAKSIRLKESVKELNAEKARTESLLYQMIPKAVADRLREGESQANTCQASIISIAKIPRLIWEEPQRRFSSREWTRPLRVLLAVQCPL